MLCISVSLPSGQTAVVSLHKESMVSELKMAAQRELKKRFLRPGDQMVWRVSWVSQRVPPQMPPPLPKDYLPASSPNKAVFPEGVVLGGWAP